jgi:hypothetical protein
VRTNDFLVQVLSYPGCRLTALQLFSFRPFLLMHAWFSTAHAEGEAKAFIRTSSTSSQVPSAVGC